MAYDELTRGWRIGYGIAGIVFTIVGGVGTVVELILALDGYILAWIAALMTAGLATLGVFLLMSVRKGRIRTLGLGRKSPTP